jgi:hypothetical protein
MEHLSQDFEVLAERADDCGALWAARTWRRLSATQHPPHAFPGSIEQARQLVGTFADRTATADRERLATLVYYAAEWSWSETYEAMMVREAPLARTG